VDERPIRMAASVICARPGEGGPEVLVVERSAASRFLPGYVAFPGGAVDPGDEQHASRWFGDAAQHQRAAAVRELFEEVGLCLVAAGPVPSVGDGFAQVDAAPPRTDQLHEAAHWIAPAEVPVRFDARYYVVEAGPDAAPTADGHEAVAAWWTRPSDLLRGWERGERKLYWPTYVTVLALEACDRLDQLLSLRFDTREPTPSEERSLPRHVMEQD